MRNIPSNLLPRVIEVTTASLPLIVFLSMENCSTKYCVSSLDISSKGSHIVLMDTIHHKLYVASLLVKGIPLHVIFTEELHAIDTTHRYQVVFPNWQIKTMLSNQSKQGSNLIKARKDQACPELGTAQPQLVYLVIVVYSAYLAYLAFLVYLVYLADLASC